MSRTGTDWCCRTSPSHVGHLVRPRSVHDGAADVASLHRHETLGLQHPQRFANRRRADAELLHEVVLFGQEVAVGIGAGQDAVAQVAGDHLGEAWPWVLRAQLTPRPSSRWALPARILWVSSAGTPAKDALIVFHEYGQSEVMCG